MKEIEEENPWQPHAVSSKLLRPGMEYKLMNITQMQNLNHSDVI
jgi:hypothetical protein